jgi:hypothetical protein
MGVDLTTSVKAGGGNEVVGTNRAWWFQNVSKQTSML